MTAYAAPVDDVAFLLGKVFDFDRCMAEIPAYEEVNAELAISVLEEAGKFCGDRDSVSAAQFCHVLRDRCHS